MSKKKLKSEIVALKYNFPEDVKNSANMKHARRILERMEGAIWGQADEVDPNVAFYVLATLFSGLLEDFPNEGVPIVSELKTRLPTLSVIAAFNMAGRPPNETHEFFRQIMEGYAANRFGVTQ